VLVNQPQGTELHVRLIAKGGAAEVAGGAKVGQPPRSAHSAFYGR